MRHLLPTLALTLLTSTLLTPTLTPTLLAQSGNPDFSVPADTKSPPKNKSKDAGQPSKEDAPKERGAIVDLRPKFRKGQNTSFKVEMNSTNDLAGGDTGKPEQVIKQEIGITLKVREVSAQGNATIDLVYDSLKFEMSSDALDVSFDSTKKATGQDDPMADVLRTVVGLSLTLEADRDGNITSVSGGSGLPAGLAQQFTGADVVKNFFGPIMNIQKGSGQVSVGDSWTNDDSIQGGMGNFRMKNTYTLSSYNAPIAKVKMSGMMNLDGSNTGPVNLREGTLRGDYEWNTEEGMLKSMNFSMRTLLETKLTGGGGDSPDTGAAPTSGSSESTIKITRR
jgi:hypothetical protein